MGAAHAFEPDHMVAVSAFVAKKPTPRQAARFGVNWSIGHGLSLLLFGSILYALKRLLEHDQPFLFSSGVLDRLVGVVLIGLGIWTLLQLRVGEMYHSHRHAHGATETHFHDGTTHFHSNAHSHSHSHSHSHDHDNDLGSLLMGMLHGGAGTGAFLVQAINVQAASHYVMIVAFTVVFSVGVLLAMGFYAAVLGGAISLAGRQTTRFFAAARLATGVLACGVGVCMLLAIEIPWFH